VTPSIASLWIVALTAAGPAAGGDALTTARDLYVAAQYREALDVLAQADVNAMPKASQPVALEYKALCLLALNREQEGVQAFEALVQAQPAYEPEPDSLSPRIRSVFDSARRRLLPGLAQTRFAEARAAFERGDYNGAVAGFEMVSTILTSARAAGAPADGGADLAMLADGFRDLAASRLGPPPARRLAVVPTQAPAVHESSPEAERQAAGAAAIVPPVVVRQDVPRWPLGLVRPPRSTAMLEVSIDNNGAVTDVRVTQSLNAVYDQLLIEAARGWRYKPALRNGQPTPYVKMIRLELVP
jgi:protein TonB